MANTAHRGTTAADAVDPGATAADAAHPGATATDAVDGRAATADTVDRSTTTANPLYDHKPMTYRLSTNNPHLGANRRGERAPRHRCCKVNGNAVDHYATQRRVRFLH